MWNHVKMYFYNKVAKLFILSSRTNVLRGRSMYNVLENYVQFFDLLFACVLLYVCR